MRWNYFISFLYKITAEIWLVTWEPNQISDINVIVQKTGMDSQQWIDTFLKSS